MKKTLFSVLAAGLLLAGLAPQASALGVIYSNVTYPLQATASNADINSLKKGTSDSENYLYLVELGDAGIDLAAKEAGIREIHHVDVHVKNYFFFYKKVTTHVYGR